MAPNLSSSSLSVSFPFDGQGSSTMQAFAIPRALSAVFRVRLHFPVDSPLRNLMSSVLMSQWFAPTKLVVTFETQGMGRFTPEEIDLCLIKDNDGNPVALNLPTKFVLIANHQVCSCHLRPHFHFMSSRSTPTGGMHGASHIS